MTYVHTFFKTIENETKIKGTKKILPKIYGIEKKGPNVENEGKYLHRIEIISTH